MEFSLHTYISALRSTGASDAFVSDVRKKAKPLADAHLPVILTLGQLAHAVNVPYRLLLKIVGRHVNSYRVFTIRKRNGGRRYICAPEPVLGTIQRWIHDHILCSNHAVAKLSACATAYRPPHSNHIVNAKPHLGAPWLLKLDITRFFESISERQVYHVFHDLGYAPLVAFCLARICTRVLPPESDIRRRSVATRWLSGHTHSLFVNRVVGHLPQGAPTSPMLSNLVCASLDAKLKGVADDWGLTYTRYADDMTFSGDIIRHAKAAKLIEQLSTLLGTYGFLVNSRKTTIAKTGGRKIVTGLSVEDSELRLPRSYKDKIRQELYYLRLYGIEGHCARIKQKNHFSYLRHLSGRIHYVGLIEPALGKKMSAEFKKLFPGFRELESLIRS